MGAVTRPARSRRTLLALAGFISLIGLGGTALLCWVSADLLEDALFGSPGTEIMLGVLAAIAVAGVVIAWRPNPVSARLRQMVLFALAAAAGLTAVAAAGFVAGGEYAAVGILLLQSAVFIVVIASLMPQSSTIARRPGMRSRD